LGESLILGRERGDVEGGKGGRMRASNTLKHHANMPLLHRLENSEPIFRGRKLILNYTGGSLCPFKASKRSLPASLSPREIIDGDDDDDEDGNKKKGEGDKNKKTEERRKTTVISLLCDNDPLAKTSISFVAAIDDCAYFFEGRSPFACGGVHQETQALGPGGVFVVIGMIAVLVYFVGGCVYQRTVMHQRGWRQLPNYAMWAGIWRFFSVSLLRRCWGRGR
jgi:cation-dependent mannose-6-phosphate receptor